jgi:hypothetical protein
MARHAQIIDAVRAGHHAGHDRGHLPRRVRPPIASNADPPGHDPVQTGLFGQPHHRLHAGTRHQTRIIKRCADRARGVL